MNKLEEIEQKIKKLKSKDYLTYDIVYKTGMKTPMSGPIAPPMMK